MHGRELRLRSRVASGRDVRRFPIAGGAVRPSRLPARAKRIWEQTYAEAIPVIARTGVSREDERLDLLEEMRTVAADERVLIAQWALIGVVAKK